MGGLVSRRRVIAIVAVVVALLVLSAGGVVLGTDLLGRAGGAGDEDPTSSAGRARGSGRAWGDAPWEGEPPPVALGEVTCVVPVDVDVSGARLSLWRAGEDGRRRRAGGKVMGREAGALRVQLPPVSAATTVTGTLDVPGFGQADVSVAEGRCTVGAFTAWVVITGRVVGATASDGETRVFGCGRGAPVDGDGGFYLEVKPEPCELYAVRVDGAFRVRSETVSVDPKPGTEVTLDLSLPAFRAAGVGTSVRAVDGGIEIQRVVEGSPAELAGLRPGDLVIGLDDEDVSGLDVETFIDLALGPEGTDVTYKVQRGDEVVALTMRRAALDKPAGW